MVKIHIVQEGDTITALAEQYHADVKALIQLNPQVSSPDMIMPGMKLKIPSESKQIKTSKKYENRKKARDKASSRSGNNKTARAAADAIAEPAERPMEDVSSENPARYPRPNERPFMGMPVDDTERKPLSNHFGDFFQAHAQTAFPKKPAKEDHANGLKESACLYCNRPMYIERPVYYPFPWHQVKPDFYIPPNTPNQSHANKKKLK